MQNMNLTSETESNSLQSIRSLLRFTERFFRTFGSIVEIREVATDPTSSLLKIKLASELVETFGKSELTLVFRPQDMQAKSELVAIGSNVFDRMMQHLEGRSALTVQLLPQHFTAGEELLSAVQPLNASIVKLKMQEQEQNLYCFNWHITYRADDKSEELYTVLLDESRARVHIHDNRDTSSEVSDGKIALDRLLSDAKPIGIEQDTVGQPQPTKIPPTTHLVRLADSARRYAIYHADVRCVEFEAEIQQRLYRVLNRLHNYYSQQIEEVYDSHDPSGEKRLVLENDLQRKLAEEVENHRLHVGIRLFGYAILKVPVAIAELHLNDGKHDVIVHVQRNRYTGSLQRPKCYACAAETTAITIDSNGHITCNDCLRQCASCMDMLCDSCGVAPCPVCAQENCDTCSKMCWACGERACAEHISGCPICHDTVCHSCQTACMHCGVFQCRTHLRADSVLDEEGDNLLICAECAVRCPGCQQYSAQIGLCEKSGQRYCKNCLVQCADCDKVIGPDYYKIGTIDRLVRCTDCLTTCPSCQSDASSFFLCGVCGSDCCANCSDKCACCEEKFCREHIIVDSECGHAFCINHAATCAIGKESFCSICSEPCAICERDYCAEHMETCALCRCAYCVECIRNSTGLCDTCSTFQFEEIDVCLADEAVATHQDIVPLVDHYRWFRADNSRYIIYLGKGSYNIGVLILLLKRADGEEVLVVRKVPVLDQYWRRY